MNGMQSLDVSNAGESEIIHGVQRSSIFLSLNNSSKKFESICVVKNRYGVEVGVTMFYLSLNNSSKIFELLFMVKNRHWVRKWESQCIFLSLNNSSKIFELLFMVKNRHWVMRQNYPFLTGSDLHYGDSSHRTIAGPYPTQNSTRLLRHS